MADDRTPADEETPQEPTAGEEQPVEEPAAGQPAGEEQPAAEEPAAGQPAGEEQPAAEEPAAEQPAGDEQPAAEQPAGDEQPAPEQPAAAEQPAAEQPAAAEEPAAEQPAAAEPAAEQPKAEPDEEDYEEDEEEPARRVKPEIPGADLEVDIVMEGAEQRESAYDEDDEAEPLPEDADDVVPDDQPIAAVTIDLAAGARYRATGKRKTAVARVILKPGDGSYLINGRGLETFFPRATLQRNIRQPLEAVGYESRMDVVARMHGGGVSAQAGALRHGISRALLEADPNLRGELKRRGFLTRDPRVKERKKAGLKKARKRPQFSKR
jgi:small subunit ribosomal protein S9